MKENRNFVRLNHRANITIKFACGETMKAHTQNMSDGGLYIHCPGHPALKEGELAEVVVMGIEDAIPRSIKIMRIDSRGGIGVEFTIA